MPANVCTPLHRESDITFQATAAVTGRRFIRPSADYTSNPLALATTSEGTNARMAHAGAGQRAFGVSEYDVASGAKGGCFGTPGRIVPVEAGAAVAAGAEVESDATGRAITLATGRPNGLCIHGAGAAGAFCLVKLY